MSNPRRIKKEGVSDAGEKTRKKQGNRIDKEQNYQTLKKGGNRPLVMN